MSLHESRLTDELRRLLRLVKRGRGKISDTTFRDLANEAYRIQMETNDDEDVVPNEVFDQMLPFFRRFCATKSIWKTTAQIVTDEELDHASSSTADLLENSDCLVLRSQVSKLGDASSSLKKCVTLSMTSLPLCIEATDDGKQMAQYMKRYFDDNIQGSLLEGRYSPDMVGLPSHMEALGPQKAATTVFPLLYSGPRFVTAAPDSQPELGLRVKPGEDHKGSPPVTLEWKSFDEAGIEELLQASTGALQDSYFRQAGQSWQFYEDPPFGIGSLYSGPSAVAVFCYEMVGRLMFSLYDSGYSLGTQKHRQVYECIKANTIEGGRVAALDLSECVHRFALCEAVGNKVRYTTQSVNGNFYKILRHDRFKKLGPKPWRDVYNVYKKLRQIEILPESLFPAKLYFGEYQVAIEMPFCAEASPCQQDLTQQQKEDLLAAIVALGKVGLCYIDFRPSNLLITTDGRLRLVDYDDMNLYQNELEVKDAYREMEPIMFDGTTRWDEVQGVVQAYTGEIQGDE